MCANSIFPSALLQREEFRFSGLWDSQCNHRRFLAALKKFEIDHFIYTHGGTWVGMGACQHLVPSQTTTVALHREEQCCSVERQVNKQLLGPLGCLLSAITGKKHF